MTVDEVCVKISVAAEEALAVLDRLAERVRQLAQTLEAGHEFMLDTEKARGELALLESAGRNAGDAAREQAGDIQGALASAFDLGQYGGFDGAEEDVRAALERVRAVMQSPENEDALETLRGFMLRAREGLLLSDEDQEAVADTWGMFFGEDGPLMRALTGSERLVRDQAGRVLADVFGLSGLEESAGQAVRLLNDTATQARESREAFAGLGREGETLADRFHRYSDSVIELNSGIQRIGEQKKAVDALKELSAQLKTCDKGGETYHRTLTEIDKQARRAGLSADGFGADMKGLDAAIAGAEKSMDAAASGMAGDLNSVIAWAESTRQSLMINGNINVNTSPAVAALNGLIAVARAALALLSALGLAGGTGGKSGGGGGGGKKKKDDDSDAEAAARAAEQARKEAIQRDYDYVDHKRHMNEITLEQELQMIERIRSAHQLNAEEIMEWEEKIYDLKKEIRERDAESIDTLADGVVEALENRYEAMRDAEIDRLDQSRQAWEQWRDDSVQAIQDQIDALDKLSAAEDNEAKDAEELRKIEKLRREIAYEQDDYNRAKLEQQLEKALESREERLRKLALQDQKDALREEIDRINDKADQQISALDKEQEGIEAAYDQRLKEAALNAEAEKLLLTQSQDQIMTLLNEYVPEYDALGKTMGEKLLDGFKSKVGNIVSWFKDFNAGIVAMQEQVAAVSNAAADSLYQSYAGRQTGNAEAGTTAGVTVNQTVQFYEPVESPSQVARRMEDVNDALGGLLA